MNLKEYKKYSGLVNAIGIASSAALLLYLARYIATGSVQFSFMAWNLLLSLLGLLFGVLFVAEWKNAWNFKSVVLFLVWLFLLPNTFYMLTDFIHVTESGDINMLFDIALIGLFAMNGFVHGILSLLLVHRALLGLYKKEATAAIVTAIILASSFAVDMGRYLRWNAWDVLVNPAGILFDITDTFLNPTNYDRSFLITGIFFVTIASLYAVAWQLTTIQWSEHGKRPKHHTK
jgi:uncharacterized membrane protein